MIFTPVYRWICSKSSLVNIPSVLSSAVSRYCTLSLTSAAIVLHGTNFDSCRAESSDSFVRARSAL